MNVGNENNLSVSECEISDNLKAIDLNANDGFTDDEAYAAPFEILAEFLSTLMARDYKTALVYCKLILQYEPDNQIVQDFYPLLQHKINSEYDAMQQDDSSIISDDNENNNKESDTSTEYYSSGSGREDGTEDSFTNTTSWSSEEDDNDDGGDESL